MTTQDDDVQGAAGAGVVRELRPKGKSKPSDQARAIVREKTGQDPDAKGPSQASQLVKLGRERYDMFMSEDGRPYGVARGGANIALPLRGRAGLRSQLARMYYDAHGAAPSQSALADAMTVLEGVAANEAPRTLHLRVACHDGGVVVDLGRPEGDCVIITPGAGWSRQGRSPVLFRRSGAMKPLPPPIHEGDGLDRLRQLVNTDEDGFRVLVAWLVAAFIPNLPHPILAFRGEQGTGKSYAAQMVISLVDPSGAPKRSAPRDLKGWATQAFNSWALCLDNVSVIPDWLSDALCRAVTGEGVVDRALYTDDDVVVLEFRRVLAMTTIDAGSLAADLAERLVTIELHLISDEQRREEGELNQAFNDAHAAILASLFDLLADVLFARESVTLTSKPRMADFARILAAVDKVNGWSTLDLYRDAARTAIADVLESEPFADAVVKLIDRQQDGEWQGTAQALLNATDTPERLPKKWPKDATRASGQLRRLAPSLRTIGINFDDTQRGPKPKKERLITLTATPERQAAEAERKATKAPPASPAREKRPLTSGNRGDASSVPPPTVENAQGDAEELWGDADPDVSVPAPHTSDLRNHRRGDAGNAGDAKSGPLSNAACACPNGVHGIHRDGCPSGTGAA